MTKSFCPKYKKYLRKIQNVLTRPDWTCAFLISYTSYWILTFLAVHTYYISIHMKVILTSTANSTQCPKASDLKETLLTPYHRSGLHYDNKKGMIHDALK